MCEFLLAGGARGRGCDVIADFAIATVDALEHDVPRTGVEQGVEQSINLGVVDVLPRILASRQNGGLGQIRHQHVRAVHQRAHRTA